VYNTFFTIKARMERCLFIAVLGLFIGSTSATEVTADTVETTGVPGSPSATTTIDGKQLPPMPDETFGGKIERNVLQSKPYWPPRVVPPKGAPNVLLIMTDDSGYGVPSTFGGVIPTPTLDRVAGSGLRYTNFHSAAVCSATRAALITGATTTRWDTAPCTGTSTGYPGYNSIMTKDKATVGKIMKDNGYVTSWFGKNHNTPSFQSARSGRSTSGRSAWASIISTASWAGIPASGSRAIWSATRPISTRTMTIPTST
jgi:hypothetical protein